MLLLIMSCPYALAHKKTFYITELEFQCPHNKKNQLSSVADPDIRVFSICPSSSPEHISKLPLHPVNSFLCSAALQRLDFGNAIHHICIQLFKRMNL